MRARLGGATLAALGGLLLALASVLPRWWHGPIQIAGKIIHNKTVHVSLLRASGCNAGDGTCVGLDVGALFRAVSLATLVAALGTAALAGLLAHASWRGSAGAPRLARGALVGAVLAVIGGVATIITLPARFEEIPVGGGSFAFFGGAVVVLAASIAALARRGPGAAATEPMDVREILSTDLLAPSALGPEPKLGRFGVVPGEGGAAAAAPRFRPWYELQGYQDPSTAAATVPGFEPPDTSSGLGPPGTVPGFAPAGPSAGIRNFDAI